MKIYKCILLLPLLLASCEKDSSEDIYNSLPADKAATWNYFVNYKNATEVATIGITERRNIGDDITGFDELNPTPFYFDGNVAKVAGKTYAAIPGEGVPFSRLQILSLVNSRKGICSAKIDSMFKDIRYDPAMLPSRTETKKDKNGAPYQYVYYDVQSKTRSGVTYVVDFEIY